MKKVVFLTLLFWIFMCQPIFASNDLFLVDDFDFSQIQGIIDETWVGEEFDFSDNIRKLISGEVDFSLENIIQVISKSFFLVYQKTRHLYF